jgi:excisionase family DNA binding protein
MVALSETPKPLLTTDEVVAEYGIGRSTLLRLRREGKLRGQRFGRQLKFLRRVIDAYLAGETSSKPAPVASAPRLRPLPIVPRTIR